MENAMSPSEQNLDTAKIKLRDALSRLEKTVEEKIKAATNLTSSSDSQISIDFSSAKDELNEIKKENEHLREENSALQSKAGSEELKARSLKEANNKVTKRIDKIISQLNVTIKEKEDA